MQEEDQDYTEEQQATYAEFSKTVYETLCKDIDRRGYVHEITFSAENDAWNMCWKERTGIPLLNLAARWSKLEDHPKDPYLHPGDPLNRDPHVSQAEEDEFQRLKAEDNGRNVYRGYMAGGGTIPAKRTFGELSGRNLQSLINQVGHLGQQYLQSYKGFENAADDSPLFDSIKGIQNGVVHDKDEVEEAFRSLEFRMEHMAAADRY